MYLPVLREGEKISGRGFDGWGGEVGWGGRRKWGRWCSAGVVDVVVEVDMLVVVEASVAAMVVKGPGWRGGTSLKRCEVGGYVGRGVWGAVAVQVVGELGGEIRRLLCSCTGAKSISSSSSSCSMDRMTGSVGCSSCVRTGLDCDESWMLSTRSNFLRGVGRGGSCAGGSFQISCAFSLSLIGSCAVGVTRGGGITKRLAGVVRLGCVEGL